MSTNGDRATADGFELGGHFYRWMLTDQGKDLMLIDRFAQMPIGEFFELVEDGFDGQRAPVLLAMIATSIRAAHPEWTVERIVRLVMNTSLTEIEFITGEQEEAGHEIPPSREEPGETSTVTSAGSSSSPTPTASSSSKTSSGAPR